MTYSRNCRRRESPSTACATRSTDWKSSSSVWSTAAPRPPPRRDRSMSASRALTEWIGFKTIIIREFGRIVRIWGQTIVPPAVTATLYFIIFGSLIGRRVGQVGGYDYMQFIAPGIIMMNVIQTSYGNVVSSFFGAKFGKHIEELLVSPLPNWLIVAGYTMGGVLRGVLVGSVVTIISLCFTRLAVSHVLAILSAAFLTSFIFALGG